MDTKRLHYTVPPPPTATTFVQADASTFRDLVQKLTGAAVDSPAKLPVTFPARASSRPNSVDASSAGIRRSPFKLQERRHTMRKLEIKLGRTTLRNSPRVVSPIYSPETPLSSESIFSGGPGSSCGNSPASEEDRAIAEKGFYLHPSPLNTPGGSEPPELLILFPLSSPSQRTRDS